MAQAEFHSGSRPLWGGYLNCYLSETQNCGLKLCTTRFPIVLSGSSGDSPSKRRSSVAWSINSTIWRAKLPLSRMRTCRNKD